MRESAESVHNPETIQVSKKEWGRFQKIAASYKLTQKYVSLLEQSNRQLDQKILEQSLLNEIAQAFSSAAYDQWNMAGFIFSVLKKKTPLCVFALLLMQDEKSVLVLASEHPLAAGVQAAIRSRMVERHVRETKIPIDPEAVSIVQQAVPSDSLPSETLLVPTLHTIPLAVVRKPFGRMGIGFEQEIPFTVEDQHFFRILASQTALFIENDRIRQAIANEKNKLEAFSKELTRSNAELQEFAHVASHDLQEPLRTVAIYTQLLAKDYRGKLDPEADRIIDLVVDGAKRMHQLISDLLEYSHVGKQEKELRPVNSEQVLDETLENLKVAIENAKALVTHGPLPEVMADDVRLVRLFQNLIGNAIKFQKLGEPPRVHISAKSQGGEWVFSIRDNGIGIEPEFFHKLFVIFQRLHSREEYPGTGIGLAVCKKIVERHHGRIWVESVPGEGTTFYFTMPVLENQET